MSEPYIGRPLRRSEDAKLVTGHGQYVEDITVPGLAHLVFLRSPHAHARVTALRIDAARKASGVVRVATAADLGPLPMNGKGRRRSRGSNEITMGRLDGGMSGDASGPIRGPGRIAGMIAGLIVAMIAAGATARIAARAEVRVTTRVGTRTRRVGTKSKTVRRS